MVELYKEDTALIIIDMISNFNFEDGDLLLLQTERIVHNIVSLKKRVTMLNIPVIYVNDNFKNWNTDFKELTEMCLKVSSKGKEIVQKVKSSSGDYHILKPSYSGFYGTPLHILLEYLNVKTLILTGIAGNMCVQFTANDAFMYNYKLLVPRDCIASKSEVANNLALSQMNEILKADTTVSENLQFKQ